MWKRQKRYRTTTKIDRLFQKANAYWNLAEMYVKEDNHKRAKKIVLDAEIEKQRAWDAVYELYPSLKGYNLNYNDSDKEIVIKEVK